MNDESKRDLANQYRTAVQTGALHNTVKKLALREVGMGIEVVQAAIKKYPNQIDGQIDYVYDHIGLKAGIGRNRNASLSTVKSYREKLKAFFHRMADLNMKVSSILEITPRQVRRVFDMFLENNYSASYMAQTNTVVRRLGVWINKPDLCPPMGYLTDEAEKIKRQGSAVQRKDWGDENLINQAIEEVAAISEVAACQLKLARHFGLRVREVLEAKPGEMVVGNVLHVLRGTKGGKSRVVPIESDIQKEVLAEALEIAEANRVGLLATHGTKTYAKARRDFYKIMDDAEITKSKRGLVAHGLRHEYANDEYKRLANVDSPIRGGPVVNPKVDKVARKKLSERLGHARPSITSHYIGHHRTLSRYHKRNINHLVNTLENDEVLRGKAVAMNVNSIYVCGAHAEGEPINANATIAMGVSVGGFGFDHAAMASFAQHVKALLGCMVVSVLPIESFDPAIPRLELIGLEERSEAFRGNVLMDKGDETNTHVGRTD